ncbi:MAG: YraN family protein [Anaerolineae bacterium]|nr:MAG: YraN family protein [Anaerolineae bacterium]
MNRRQQLGRWGEEVAARYLREKGYVITARNVRTPYGEIDLIAQDEENTLFVEVKTRASRAFGPPEIAVTPRKQEHMRAAAAHYAQEHGIEHWQIDLIAVEGRPGGRLRVVHFENVVQS